MTLALLKNISTSLEALDYMWFDYCFNLTDGDGMYVHSEDYLFNVITKIHIAGFFAQLQVYRDRDYQITFTS